MDVLLKINAATKMVCSILCKETIGERNAAKDNCRKESSLTTHCTKKKHYHRSWKFTYQQSLVNLHKKFTSFSTEFFFLFYFYEASQLDWTELFTLLYRTVCRNAKL